jgi:hypothetical protein
LAGCRDPRAVAVDRPQHALNGVAQPDRLFQHRVEYRGEVAGRGVDDLQYLGGRGLLLEGFVTLGFALGKLTLQIGYKLLGIG